MKVDTIKTAEKQVMKVYAARDYDIKRPRLTDFVEVNIPEYTPTVPRDDKYENHGLSSKYTLNDNYPINSGTIKAVHYLTLPLLRGSRCPVYFKKDTPFILFTPTTRLEDGYLLYI